MRVKIFKNYEELSINAAKIIKEQIEEKKESVLGLATGSTPLGTYKELKNMYIEGLDFSNIKTFNLDEYYGISKDNKCSYNYFMNNNLFKYINIPDININIPDGEAVDPSLFCEEYERKIKEAGGIDLQLLGIGKNGHIGFNEPDIAMDVLTHLTDLTEDTIEANSRFFNSIEQVPKKAITMGLGTIMKSRRILLIASGDDKKEILEKMFKEKVVTTSVPASFLFLHPNVDILIDEAASSLINKQEI